MTASIASRVPEAFQTELMQDNRVAMHSDKLWRAAAQELKWVIDLPAATFAMFG